MVNFKNLDWPKFTKDMGNVDPDFRQMALFDLQQYLTKNPEVVLTEDQLQLITNMMIQSFGPRERNKEVQSNALRVVGVVAQRIPSAMQEALLRKLIDYVTNPKEQVDGAQELTTEDRRGMVENSSVGLKIMADTVPDIFNVALTTPLVTCIAQKKIDEKVANEVFSVLTVAARRVGGSLKSLHDKLLSAVIDQWDQSTSLHKQQIACLADLSPHLSEALYEKLVRWSILRLSRDPPEGQKTHIQLLSLMAVASGLRWSSEMMNSIIHQLLRTLNDAPKEGDEGQMDAANVVRDTTLRCMATVMRRCPRFAVHWDAVANQAAELMSWDPNFDDDIEDYGSDEEEDAYELDGDSSWRVRRAAMHFFEVAYEVPEYRSDVRQRLLSSTGARILPRLQDRVNSVMLGALQLVSQLALIPSPELTIEIAPSANLIRDAILRAARSKEPKVQLAAIASMKSLTGVVSVTTSMLMEISSLTRKLSARHEAVWAECLGLLAVVIRHSRPLLEGSSEAALVECMEGFRKVVQQHVGDTLQKSAVSALTSLVELIGVMRFLPDRQATAGELFGIAVKSLKSRDKVVATAAIDAVTALFSNDSNVPPSSLPSAAMREAVEDMTRMLGDDSLVVRAANGLGSISMGLDPNTRFVIVKNLIPLLTRSSVTVREAGLRALRQTFLNGVPCDPATATELVKTLCVGTCPPLSDKDIALSGAGMSLCAALVKCDAAVSPLESTAVPCVLKLLVSPSLPHAVPLDAAAMVEGLAGSGKVNVAGLSTLACNATFAAPSESAAQSLALLAAAVAAKDSDAQRVRTLVKKCVELHKDAEVSNPDGLKPLIPLLLLGELGSRFSLDAEAHKVLLDGLLHKRDSVRRVSEHAIGRASFADCGRTLLNEIIRVTSEKTVTVEKYPYLRALKSALSQAVSGPSSIAHDEDLRRSLANLFYTSVSTEQRGTIDVVGEALAFLASFNPAESKARIEADLNVEGSEKESVRAPLAVSTLKFCTYALKNEPDEFFRVPLEASLRLLRRDAPLVLRGAVLHLISTLARSRSKLLMGMSNVAEVTKGMIEELEVDPTQVQIIQLGPFMHTDDKGLDVRKAAFDCFVALLDQSLGGGAPVPEELLSLALKKLIYSITEVPKPTMEQRKTLESDMDNKVTAALCIEKILALSNAYNPATWNAPELAQALRARAVDDPSKLEARELAVLKVVANVMRKLRDEPFSKNPHFAGLPAPPTL